MITSRSDHNRSARAFTLIEVLVAVTIAMMLMAVITGILFQVRKMSARTEARLVMHERAALVHAQLMRRVTAANQSCGLVMEWDGGYMRLLFMRGVLDNNDWNNVSDSISNGVNADYTFWPSFSSDQVWELWEWSQSEHVLRVATSSVLRKYRLNSTTLGGIPYNNNPMVGLAQPHRVFDPASWKDTLNSNLMFPDYTRRPTPTSRLRDIPGMMADDVGDWQDLRRRLVPILAGDGSERQDPADPSRDDGVIDFAIRIARLDGTTAEVTPESTNPTVVVFPGAPVDGETTGVDIISPRQRPVLLKLCWTLRDRRTGLSQPFSYSIPFPSFSAGR